MESHDSPVGALSQNTAKCKHSTKVYAATNKTDDDDTGKVTHLSHFCWSQARQKLTSHFKY